MLRTRFLFTMALITAVLGCAEELPGIPYPTIGTDDPDGETEVQEEPQVNLGQEMFRVFEADLVSECASCHAIGGAADTPFLGDPDSGDPDPYETITSWPGIVVSDAMSSVLITWPGGGAHNGPPSTPELEAQLIAWLEQEAAALDDVADEPMPTIPPFKPIVGFNAVYLDALGPELAGMSVTFEAAELTESVLSLTNMQLIPTAEWGIGVEHPLFSVYAPGSTAADPDPVDSFSNVVQELAAGGVDDLGPGSLILTNWIAGGKLSLSFLGVEALPPGQGSPGGGTAAACAALTEFEDNAIAALQNSCTGCHGGGNQTATNAVDMSDLATDTAAACTQILTRVSLDNPAQSQLFVTTDPNGNASHPFKFGGNQNNHQSFVDAVSAWLAVEAQ